MRKDKLLESLLDHRVANLTINDDPRITFTYRNLKDIINGLPDSILDQQVEALADPNNGKPARLKPVIATGTVEELCHVNGEVVIETRSSVDFTHRPHQLVLLTDHNGFGEDGDTFYKMTEDGLVGNKSGKVKQFIKRGYGEPSVKVSRTKAFEKRMDHDDETLASMQEDLAFKVDSDAANDSEKALLNDVQAELYRRRYRLTPKKK